MITDNVIARIDNKYGTPQHIEGIDNIIHELKRYKLKIQKEQDEKGDNSECQVIDLTDKFKEHCGTEKSYRFPSEQDLAKYAVTKLVNEFGCDARNSKNFAISPSNCTIATDINQSTVVFEDITANLKIKSGKSGKKIKATGMVQALQMRESYNVIFAADSKGSLVAIENEYLKLLEYNNFFQGKSLRFSSNGVVFISCPNITLKEAVLPPNIIKEYQINVLDFLTDDKYHDITKKRALLLYGPPGGGKTTSLKALFSVLRKEKITCMYLTDDTFKRHSLESVFDFINKYLSPCLIAFEDIDLIGEDRRYNHGGIIGSLLSVLNGVEEYKKPIVIVGTTNRIDILDDAVIRPCRFDRKLFIDYPTTQNLRRMFKNMTGLKPPAVIKQSDNKKNKLTGAHVKEICNTAQILAIRNGESVMDCVEEAVSIIRDSFYLASSVTGFQSQTREEIYDDPEEKAEIATSAEPDPFERADGGG